MEKTAGQPPIYPTAEQPPVEKTAGQPPVWARRRAAAGLDRRLAADLPPAAG